MSFKVLIDPPPPAYLHVPRWYLFAHPILTNSQDRARREERSRVSKLYSNAPVLLSVCPNAIDVGSPARAPSVARDGTRPTAAGTGGIRGPQRPLAARSARLRAASPLGLPAPPGADKEWRAPWSAPPLLSRRPRAPRPPFPRARPPKPRFPENTRVHANWFQKHCADKKQKGDGVNRSLLFFFFLNAHLEQSVCVCGSGIHRKPRNRTARIHRFQRTHPVGLRAGSFSSSAEEGNRK